MPYEGFLTWGMANTVLWYRYFGIDIVADASLVVPCVSLLQAIGVVICRAEAFVQGGRRIPEYRKTVLVFSVSVKYRKIPIPSFFFVASVCQYR